MTTVSVIAAGGGDYTTIQLAVDDADVTSEAYIVEIQDSSSYAAFTISGVTGTPSITNYVQVTVDSSNRHAGVFDTGKARVVNTSSGTHCAVISTDFSFISWLQLHQDSAGSSDEGIRITSGINDVLIDYNIIIHDNGNSSTDGIYAGNWAMDASISNNIIYGWGRGSILGQNFSGSNTQTWSIDHCTILQSATAGSADSGGITNRADSSATTVMNVFNTFVGDTQSADEDFVETDNGTHTWTGTHNGDTDDTSSTTAGLTSGQTNLTTADTSQGSGSFFVVKDLTGGSEDYRLLNNTDAGNLALGNGTNRIGSEPDARQDFTTSIDGGTRGAVTDIGASQLSTQAAGGATGKSNPLMGSLGGCLSGAIA